MHIKKSNLKKGHFAVKSKALFIHLHGQLMCANQTNSIIGHQSYNNIVESGHLQIAVFYDCTTLRQNLSMRFPARPETNQSVQTCKMAKDD